MLDARRKAGDTLKAMQDKGELAVPGDAMSQRGTSATLKDLGLTRNQSSRYQQEATVAEPVYREWVERINPEPLEVNGSTSSTWTHGGSPAAWRLRRRLPLTTPLRPRFGYPPPTNAN